MRNGLKSFGQNIFSKPKSIVLFLLAALMISASLFVYSPVSAAGEAQWSDDTYSGIYYNSKTFRKVSASEKNNLPKSVQSDNVYIYEGTASISSGATPIEIIVVNKKEDPASAKLSKYTMDTLGNFKEQNGNEDIEIKGVAAGSGSSCSVEGGGGWLVCMIANTLARAMDGLYNILQSFLDVQPLKTTDKSALFQVWDYMRNIANVLFVILLIIVIYSQITSVGISNYGVKKMLPKIIVAAILINLSYYICSILIDLSNIAGHQLQNLFVSIRTDIFENPANGIEMSGSGDSTITWTSVTTAVLGGTGALVYGASVFSGGLGSALWLLVIGLVGVVFSVLVAVVILAARQAIITVLVFLAPLAFAANILPNTEKWFEKWKDLFSTMLFMYPLFALLFGGAQLAGTTIIANANGNAITLVLGMIVQVVPLVVTPFLISFSGGLLGKFAGMINNPNKGPFDKAKNFAREQSDFSKNKAIAKSLDPSKLNGKGRPRFGSAGWANQISYNRRQRHTAQKGVAENRQQTAFNNIDSDYIEKANNAGSAELRDKYLSKSYQFKAGQAKLDLELSNENTNEIISGLKASLFKETFEFDAKGKIVGIDKDRVNNLSKNFGKTSADLLNTMNSLSATKLAGVNNQAMFNNSLATALKHDDELLKKSAGSRGEAGKNISLGVALSSAAKTTKEERDSLSKLALDGKFNRDQSLEIIDGKNVTLANGITLDSSSDTVRSLALEKAFQTFGYTDKHNGKLVIPDLYNRMAAGGDLHDIRIDGIDAFKNAKKDDYQTLGGAFFEQSSSGKVTDFQLEYVKSWKKMNAETLLKTDPDILADISKQLKTYGRFTIPGLTVEQNKASMDAIKASIENIHSSQEMKNRIKGVQKDSYDDLVKHFKL